MTPEPGAGAAGGAANTAAPAEILLSRDGGVALITLNRPQALNALSRSLMASLATELGRLAQDKDARCLVLWGGPKAFSAGADVNEMKAATPADMSSHPHLSRWDLLASFPKPVIAAVAGYAFGGGLELAMACDLVVCGESATLGQPEINIGVIPGAGGTQRLARALGRARAMELLLTGRPFSAREAHAGGLVNRVVADESVLPEAMRLAREIAQKPPLAVQAAKKSVLYSFEQPLAEGLAFERRLFYALFNTDDQKEGMRAFIEKRRPVFTGQ